MVAAVQVDGIPAQPARLAGAQSGQQHQPEEWAEPFTFGGFPQRGGLIRRERALSALSRRTRRQLGEPRDVRADKAATHGEVEDLDDEGAQSRQRRARDRGVLAALASVGPGGKAVEGALDVLDGEGAEPPCAQLSDYTIEHPSVTLARRRGKGPGIEHPLAPSPGDLAERHPPVSHRLAGGRGVAQLGHASEQVDLRRAR